MPLVSGFKATGSEGVRCGISLVGRVGGLVVALGIGAAAFGAAAPAWAAPDAAGSPIPTPPRRPTASPPHPASGCRRSPGQRMHTRAASLAQKNSGPAVAESVSAPHPPIGSQSANRAVPRVAATVASNRLVEVQPVSPSQTPLPPSRPRRSARSRPRCRRPLPPVSGTVGSVPTSLLGTNPGARSVSRCPGWCCRRPTGVGSEPGRRRTRGGDVDRGTGCPASGCRRRQLRAGDLDRRPQQPCFDRRGPSARSPRPIPTATR